MEGKEEGAAVGGMGGWGEDMLQRTRHKGCWLIQLLPKSGCVKSMKWQ